MIKSVDPVLSTRRWARFLGGFWGDFWRSGMVGPKVHSSGGGWLIDYGGIGDDVREPGFLWGARIIDDPSASRFFFFFLRTSLFSLCSFVKLFSSIKTFGGPPDCSLSMLDCTYACSIVPHPVGPFVPWVYPCPALFALPEHHIN